MKHKPTLIRNTIITAMALLALAACGAAAPKEATQDYAIGGEMAPMPAAEAPMAPAMEGMVAEAPAMDKSNAAPGIERVVIINVDMSIVVDDPIAKMDQIAKMAEGMGGFVVSSNVYQTTTPNAQTVPEGSINVRVPAEQLDAAMAQIKANTADVQYENRSGQDVTDQYVDLQSQLKAKQAAETKLYEILDKAETAEDTLLVFNQLTQVQSEIEILKGQINYYEQAAALSSINVHIVANDAVQPIEVGGWKPVGVAKDAIEALIKFFQGLVDFLIWLVIFIIPMLLVAILVIFVVWKITSGFWKRLFKGKKTPAEGENK